MAKSSCNWFSCKWFCCKLPKFSGSSETWSLQWICCKCPYTSLDPDFLKASKFEIFANQIEVTIIYNIKIRLSEESLSKEFFFSEIINFQNKTDQPTPTETAETIPVTTKKPNRKGFFLISKLQSL